MDMTPGDSGYRSYFQNAGSMGTGLEIIGSLVFVLLNGGSAPPYVADLPEPGTVFRITGGIPQAPIPSAPANGSTVGGDTAGFFWQTQLGRPARLQFSTEPDFRTISVQLDDVMPATEVRVPYPGWYWWRVIDFLGAVSVPQTVEFVFSVAVETGGDLPIAVALRSVYPNPFSTSTRISLDLPDAGTVTLRLYDVTGRLVSRIAESSLLPAGTHEFRLDGASLPSGVYLLDMVAGEVRLSRTVVVVH